MYEKHRLEWPTAKYCTQPRRIGLICAITSLMGRDRWLRKICLSVRNSAVRFFPRGLLVHLDLERRQFLSKSPFDRRTKPALARMSVYQNH